MHALQVFALALLWSCAAVSEVPRSAAALESSRLVVAHPRNKSAARIVHSRLCYAGRYRVVDVDTDGGFVDLRLVERVASGEDHPNAEGETELRALLVGERRFDPRKGATYCLVLTHGSKAGMTVEAYGPDDATTLEELRKMMRSPEAFGNDVTSRKRRALWKAFRKTAPETVIRIYCEDDALSQILFIPEGEEDRGTYFLFELNSGTTMPLMPAKLVPRVNRITFEGDAFLVWQDGVVELSLH